MEVANGVITVNKDLPVDNADVLGGTLLDPIPGPGTLLIWVASSQRDGVMTVTGAAVLGGSYKIPPVLRASGIPAISDDVPVVVPVRAGRAVLDYDEVTAGDAFASIMFVPA